MSLQKIAEDMRRTAIHAGVASAVLPRGLRIRLEVHGSNRRLAIARTDVPPSITERGVVASAFGVAGNQWNGRCEYNSRLGCNLHICEMEYVEQAEEVV